MVTYSVTTPCGTATASVTVVVQDPTDAGTIGGPTPLCPGTTGSYTASVSGGIWSISPTSIATITPGGLVTAISGGTAIITYYVTNACGTASVTASVDVGGLAGLTTNPAAVSCNHLPVVLTASVSPAGATGVTYTWSPGTGLSATTGSSVTFTGLSSTIVYTVTATDGTCTVTAYDTLVTSVCMEACEPMYLGATVVPLGVGGTISTSITGSTTTLYYIDNPVYPAAYTVTITANLTMNNAVVAIAPNVTILIAPGLTSVIIQTSHLFCCADNEMWNGIIVSPTSKLIFFKNSFIEDADTAVAYNEPATAAYLYSSEVLFNRCHVGIAITNDNAATPTVYPFTINQSVFTSRNYLGYSAGAVYPFAWPSDATLVSYLAPTYTVYAPLKITAMPYGYVNCKDGQPANIGVFLNNIGPIATFASSYPGITVGLAYTVSPYTTISCLMDNLQYGIYATDANFQSQGNIFMAMQSYTVNTGYGGGDGIFAYHKQGFAASTNVYQMLVGTAGGSGNWFYECRDGIECSGYTKVNIQKTKMWSDHKYGYPMGAYTDGYMGINIGGANPSTLYNTISMTNNYISNYDFGINYVSRTDITTGTLTISNDTIIGQSGYWTDGFDSVAIIVNNELTGTSHTFGGAININANEIVNVYNGIIVNGFLQQPVTTTGNDVLLIKNLISAVTTQQYGIYQTYCKNNNINSNYITGDIAATNILNFATGIYGGTNTNALMQCNAENYLDVGFDLEGTSNFTTWTNNVMAHNNRGMQFKDVFGVQGGMWHPSDNYWDPSSGWTTFGPFQTFANSPAYPSNIIWDRAGTGLDPFNNSGVPGDAYSHTTPISIRNTVSLSGYRPCVPATPSFSYNDYRTMTDSSGIDSGFVQGWSNKQPGYESIVKLTYRDSVADSAMSATAIAQCNWVAQKRVFDEIQTDSSLIDSSALLNEFNNLSLNSRYAWLGQIENYLQQHDSTNAQTLLGYSTDFYSVSSTDTSTGVIIADNTLADGVVNGYLNIYNAYLHYLKGTTNSNDSTHVRAIAALCPGQYGSIVYTARSLYWQMYNDMSIFADICPVEYSTIRKMQHKNNIDADTSQVYTLYPNPNNGMLVLSQKHMDNKPITITVSNIIGQRVCKQTVLFLNGQYKLQLPPSAKQGVYFLEVKDDLSNMYNLKFVVE